MSIKYNKDLLLTFCNENNIELLKEYNNDNLKLNTKILIKCKSCNKETEKVFNYMVKTKIALCKRCITLNSLIKQRETLKEKYGVTHQSQIPEVKEKMKETFIKNYGVDNPAKNKDIQIKTQESCLKKYGVKFLMQNDEIKEKIKETCLERFGVENPSQCKEIKEKMKATCLKRFGVENASQCQEVKEKMKATCLERFGVEYPLQNIEIMNNLVEYFKEKYGVDNPMKHPEIRDKINKTIKEKYGVNYPSQCEEIQEKIIAKYIERYGVKNPMQNSIIAEKSSKNSFSSKKFIMPSGKVIFCQGYEPFALKDLLNNNVIESDIITSRVEVPTLWYIDNNNIKHRHYVDIFIPSQNKCIEIKSTWTIKKENSNIFLKQLQAKEKGFFYEIWVYNSKGECIEKYT